MSSEGSVTSSGSRIRQFGLYRTIDARTEEFLRSSRKRQIRQGCACAAISTAITVTVVVTVILVYEYSINSQATNVNKKVTTKPNWIGVINDSDITSISSKFNKKVNFDRTTLKLLPILLKALNKNRYLEKILEDYSSSSPPFAGKDSTETFTRNIFANSKNWLKLPTTRHYAVDYKTSPLSFWKNPTQRQDYLTKIRKIRDYQRMLNYFDKMINDKNGSNQRKDFEFTERPFVSETAPMKKSKPRKVAPHQPPVQSTEERKEYKSEEKGAHTSCRCPKRLGNLLSKLIAGIQDIMPHIINNKESSSPCSKTKSVTVPTPHKSVQETERKPKPDTGLLTKEVYTAHPVRTYFDNERKSRRKFQKPERIKTTTSKIITSTSTTSRTPLTTSTITPTRTTTSTTSSTTSDSTTTTRTTTSTTDTSSSTTSSTDTTSTAFTTPTMFTSTTEPTATTTVDDKSLSETKDSKTNFEQNTVQMPTKMNMLLSTLDADEKHIYDYDFIFKPTDIYSETSKKSNIKTPTTEMFVPIKFIDSSHESTTTDKWLASVSSLRPRINVPLFKEEEYDDYFITTPSKSTSELENFELPDMKLIKNKMSTTLNNPQPTGFRDKMIGKLKTTSSPANKPEDSDLAMRKMADLIYSPQEKTTKETKYSTETRAPVPFYGRYTDPTLLIDLKTTNSIDNNKNARIPHSTSSKDTKRMSEVKIENEETKISGDGHISENVLDDELQEEYGYRLEVTTKVPDKYSMSPPLPGDSNKTGNANTVKMKTPNKLELTKKKEKLMNINKQSKSMLPSMRPIYLQIQRNNEWRQDDHADYDINFNNNIFDLPNIN